MGKITSSPSTRHVRLAAAVGLAGISKLMLCAETGVAKLPLVLRSWLEIALMAKRHLSS